MAIPLVSLCVCIDWSEPARATEPTVDDPAWLDWVAPLIGDEEKEAFEHLDHRYERAAFIERFWRSRDPDPSTPRNELRAEWAERLSIADEQFGGRTTDRGLAFLLNGGPDFILSDLCPEILKPLEIWIYGDPSVDLGEETKTLLFSGPSEDEMQLEDGDAASIESLLLAEAPPGVAATRQFTRRCRRGREILAAIDGALGRAEALTRPSSGDWLDRFAREVEGSADTPLACEIRIEYPSRIDGRTAVDGYLTLRPESPTPARTVTLEGEVYRGDRSADHFRYRFEAPHTSPNDPAVLSFRRYLAPGAYRIVLTARDLTHGRSMQSDTELRVPSPASTSESGTAGGESRQTSFKIRPLPLGLLTGPQRVEVAASSERIASVEFLLDNRRIMKKSRPPFSVEIDLGESPRTHTLEAIALTGDGVEIARDSVPINAGPHRFSVRILEPRLGQRYGDRLRVHAQVDTPPDERLDRVEFFLNEERLSTLYQPPFVQPRVDLPRPSGPGYVRALAILDDGNSAEDLVVVNAGGSVDELQVDFVEIYAGVVDRKGAPVTNLTKGNFTVVEDGLEQSIRRFETVRDLPINAVVLLDASESMYEEIGEAKEGAARFFENVLRPMDRAAVVVFSDKPEIEVPLTNDPRRLAGGIEDVTAGGETTLYDSVVFGLYYLVGLRGKKALVLLTDGADSNSRYDFTEMVDFARSSGVAVYAIGIGLSSREIEAQRVLRTLARETGGHSYFIRTAGELERIYERIENELRSQYLIGYQSTQSESDDFRRVEVSVDRKDLDVRTIPGYQP